MQEGVHWCCFLTVCHTPGRLVWLLLSLSGERTTAGACSGSCGTDVVRSVNIFLVTTLVSGSDRHSHGHGVCAMQNTCLIQR